MNSSTSSFKSELRVIAAVLAVLLVVELGFRRFATGLSLDLEHIRSIPGRAKKLADAPGHKILVLGNSITRDGIDFDLLASRLAKSTAPPVHVAGIYPDGTSINEWYFAFNRFFAEQHILPDLLVIVTTGTHLNDSPLLVSRNSASFCSAADARAVFLHELSTIDKRTEFVLARFSSAFANRDRVQPRLFSLIVPHYQEFLLSQQGKRIEALTLERAQGVPEPEITHHRLAQLLETASRLGVPVLVYTAPMTEPYRLQPEILRLLEEHDVVVLEGQALAGITAGNLPDGSHLDKAGARIFTEHLADELVSRLLGR